MNSGKSRYLSGCRWWVDKKNVEAFIFLLSHAFPALHFSRSLKICNQNKFPNKCSIAYIIGSVCVCVRTFICLFRELMFHKIRRGSDEAPTRLKSMKITNFHVKKNGFSIIRCSCCFLPLDP